MRSWPAVAVVALAALVQFALGDTGEPWRNGDETRHVFTGVFMRDALFDAPESLLHPVRYAGRYYEHAPALGLLVWPPLFYMAEGAAMSVLGPEFWVAKCTLWAFALWGASEAYAMYRRTLGGRAWATLALALACCGPLIVDLGRFVLLELPTLALVLATVNRFEGYLRTRRARLAVLTGLLAALAALTRFDAVVLLPYFALRLAPGGNWRRLGDRPVLLGAALAVLLCGPYYLLTLTQYKAGIATAATAGTAVHATGFLAPENALIYPAYTPRQAGRFAVLAALVGALSATATGRAARRLRPLLALVGATFLAFVPLAEPESRHAVYWVPALAGLGAAGARWVWRRGPRLGALAAFGLVFATGWQSVWDGGDFMRGYALPARYVLANRTANRPVLFDGNLTGGFIYQVRLADPARALKVLRTDKLLYAVMSDPHGGYVEWAKSDAEVLERLHAADPEFIVVESPIMFGQDNPASRRLYLLLRRHPERFPLAAAFRLDTNHEEFAPVRLEVYRKLDRNPVPETRSAVPVLGLGRSVGGD